MESRNRTNYKFEWDIEDDLDGFIEADKGHNSKLATDFPGLILEDNIPGSVNLVGAKVTKNIGIAAADYNNSGIVNTPVVCVDYNGSPTPILKRPKNPSPDD